MLEQQPAFKIAREQLARQLRTLPLRPQPRGESPIIIPVVVNLIYSMEPENLRDDQILSQIVVLNEDFRRRNADATDHWSQAAGANIEFRLATRDPLGQATNGIRRRYTLNTAFRDDDAVKFTARGGLDAWPTNQYLNIWVCNLEFPLTGYAQYPGGPPATDGVVIDYAVFGRTETLKPPFHRGRTATHEVGHWLNLDHPWGDGDCLTNDGLPDTPPCDRPHFQCRLDAATCGGPNMVENFMEYSDDDCMNLFTLDQVRCMEAMFAPGGPREGFLDSRGSTPLLSHSLACGDGQQNGLETGIDCGSPDCPPCLAAGCLPPTQLRHAQEGTTVVLSWVPLKVAQQYQVEIRQTTPTVGKWSVRLTSDTQVTVTGFRIGRSYEWRLQSLCEDQRSEFATALFTTRSQAPTGNRFASIDGYLAPNPANQTVWIHWPEDVENPTGPNLRAIRLLHSHGGLALEQVIDTPTRGPWSLNLSQLPSGWYWVQLITDQTPRLIPQPLLIQRH